MPPKKKKRGRPPKKETALDKSAARLTALASLDLERKVIDLKLKGKKNVDIAAELDVSQSAVYNVLKRGMERITSENNKLIKHMRGLEVLRLDRLQEGIWTEAIGGHLTSIDRVLRIMERRAALLGLDSPVEVSATVNVNRASDLGDDELAMVIAQAKETGQLVEGDELESSPPVFDTPGGDGLTDDQLDEELDVLSDKATEDIEDYVSRQEVAHVAEPDW